MLGKRITSLPTVLLVSLTSLAVKWVIHFFELVIISVSDEQGCCVHVRYTVWINIQMCFRRMLKVTQLNVTDLCGETVNYYQGFSSSPPPWGIHNQVLRSRHTWHIPPNTWLLLAIDQLEEQVSVTSLLAVMEVGCDALCWSESALQPSSSPPSNEISAFAAQIDQQILCQDYALYSSFYYAKTGQQCVRQCMNNIIHL